MKSKKKQDTRKKPKSENDNIPDLIEEDEPLEEEDKLPHFSDLPDPTMNMKKNQNNSYFRTNEEIKTESDSNIKYTSSKYFAKKEIPERPKEQQEEIDRILALGDCSNPYDYYKALKLDKNPFDPTKISADEIKRSYFKICMKVHPDQNGDEQAFHSLSEAYQILSDPKQKETYDEDGVKLDIKQVNFDDALRAFFDIDVTWKYGKIIHHILYFLILLYRFSYVNGVLLLQVTKKIYETQLKSAIASSIITGLIAYYFSRSIFYSGCLFCFRFSFLLASIIGYYVYFSRDLILLLIVKFKDQLLPIKYSVSVISIMTFVFSIILRYSYWDAFYYSFFYFTFRHLVLIVFGLVSLAFRLLFDNTLVVAAVLLVLQIFISKYFEFSWPPYLLSIIFCIILTLQVFLKRYQPAEETEDE